MPSAAFLATLQLEPQSSALWRSCWVLLTVLPVRFHVLKTPMSTRWAGMIFCRFGLLHNGCFSLSYHSHHWFSVQNRNYPCVNPIFKLCTSHGCCAPFSPYWTWCVSFGKTCLERQRGRYGLFSSSHFMCLCVQWYLFVLNNYEPPIQFLWVCVVDCWSHIGTSIFSQTLLWARTFTLQHLLANLSQSTGACCMTRADEQTNFSMPAQDIIRLHFAEHTCFSERDLWMRAVRVLDATISENLRWDVAFKVMLLWPEQKDASSRVCFGTAQVSP